MVRVKYITGDIEFFPGNDYRYLPERNVFEVITGNHKVWLPVTNVKSIGCGSMVDGEFKYD